MVILWFTLQACWLLAAALPVAFPGNFTLTNQLTSASLTMPAASLITCQTAQTQSITAGTVSVEGQTTVQDVRTDLLVASGESLLLAGLVQITGSVQEVVQTPATTFLQTKKKGNEKQELSSFLAHDTRHLNDLEAQLNRVGLGVYNSFLETPEQDWKLHGIFEASEMHMAKLPPHRKVMLRTNVRYISPEWSGQVVTLHVGSSQVDKMPVWQAAHSWGKPWSCEGGKGQHTEMVAVTLSHRSASLSFAFSTNLANTCGVEAPWTLDPVLVYYR